MVGLLLLRAVWRDIKILKVTCEIMSAIVRGAVIDYVFYEPIERVGE